jgi:hypothetical protein
VFIGDGVGMIFIPLFLKFEKLTAGKRAEFGTMFDITK